MELQQYTHLAIRTEKQIPQILINKEHLGKLLTAYVEIGNILDTVKKNVFYGKPYDSEQQNIRIETAISALTNLYEQQFDLTTSPLDINSRIFHSIIGIATESTELVEALYKAEYMSNQLDVVNLTEEVADAMWYAAILHDEVDIPISHSLERNINKLKVRFPDKFTESDALHRDLDTERAELSKQL